MSSTYKELSTTFEEKLTDIEDGLVFSPSFKLRPTVFAGDEVARAALLIPLPRSPLSLSNGHCQELASILNERPWPLLGRFEEAAINEEEEQDSAAGRTKSTNIKKAPKDQVGTRAHQKDFLASLQPTPSALQQNGSGKKRFDEDRRLVWLKAEKYIKTGTIQPHSVVCGCCAEELSTNVPKAKKRGRKGKGKKNGIYAPSAWIAHRKTCAMVYEKWLGETERTDETWSFGG
ncbi:hypothetical protein BDZ89DRAFT_1244240 [Hymenopellis radicata]|nr:hypothetical protein BDZ89DRAFT_1244240 [Hymenopellis radicata]